MPVNEWNEIIGSPVLGVDNIKSSDIIDSLEKENIESRPIWKPCICSHFIKAMILLAKEYHENIRKWCLFTK